MWPAAQFSLAICRVFAYTYILSHYRRGRNRFLFFLFFFYFLPFRSHSSRLLAAGFRSSSSRRQHAEIECRESSVDKSPLSFLLSFFPVSLSLWDDYSVSMGACGCCAAICKHSCRAATSVRTAHLFAGRIRSSELRGTRVKAERPTNVTRDESAKVVIDSRNVFLYGFTVDFSLAKILTTWSTGGVNWLRSRESSFEGSLLSSLLFKKNFFLKALSLFTIE